MLGSDFYGGLLTLRTYDLNQPRVEKGQPGGGPWTSGGGVAGTPSGERAAVKQAQDWVKSWTYGGRDKPGLRNSRCRIPVFSKRQGPCGNQCWGGSRFKLCCKLSTPGWNCVGCREGGLTVVVVVVEALFCSSITCWSSCSMFR